MSHARILCINLGVKGPSPVFNMVGWETLVGRCVGRPHGGLWGKHSLMRTFWGVRVSCVGLTERISASVLAGSLWGASLNVKRTTGKPSASWVAEAVSLLRDLGTWLSRILLDILTANHWPTLLQLGITGEQSPFLLVSLQFSLLRKCNSFMFILKGEMLKGIPCCHRAYTAGFIMELWGNKLMSSTQGIK